MESNLINFMPKNTVLCSADKQDQTKRGGSSSRALLPNPARRSLIREGRIVTKDMAVVATINAAGEEAMNTRSPHLQRPGSSGKKAEKQSRGCAPRHQRGV